MKKLFLLTALGCASAAFGNYSNQQGYQDNQPYYQSQGTTYNQSQPSGGYYQTQPQGQSQSYNQNQNQGYYQQQQPYQQQPYQQEMSGGYISETMPMSTPNGTQTQIKAPDSAATEQDRQINQRIRDRLANLGINGYETIILRTNNGIVMISGSIDTMENLMKIKEQIKNVEGVKSVNSQLTSKSR